MDRYSLAAPIYDACTAVWTGGAIWATRESALEGAGPGTCVLVPGPGTGRSAALAARRGARVVAVERAPSMARRARRRATRAGVDLELVEGDVRDLPPGLRFDLVLAEHFLNVFGPRTMPGVRSDLIDRVRVGGRFAIADFTPARRGLRGLPQRLYHALPLGGCALLTGNALHPIYDHGADLADDPRVVLESQRDARIFGVGPGWFRTWTFRRVT